jgi:hypothetical protein
MKYETKKFTIECEMNERWIPHFLSMLKYMQQLGGLGSSRYTTIYSDGDGDFRPKFVFDSELLPEVKKPVVDNNGNRTYDAG